MFHKNSTQETFPFSESHIEKFKDELIKAGGFDELMFKKFALKKENGITYVATYDDIETYKEVFLVGIYESLKDFYDTDTPYSFWTELNDIVQKRDNDDSKE